MNQPLTTDKLKTIGHSILARILNPADQRDSLVINIAEEIGSAIIEGHLNPGDDLNSVDLADRFKTSRTPVREAMMLLEKEGLVEILPRRRPRVAKLSITDVREIYQVRANLYGLVAELIVNSASNEAVQSLQPHLEQMAIAAEKQDLDAYFWPNVAFQDTETTICGNTQVKRILDSLMLRMLQLRYLSLTAPGRLQQSLADHERLLRAYKERDSALAMAIKRGIVMRGLANIEKSGWVELNGSADNPGNASKSESK